MKKKNTFLKSFAFALLFLRYLWIVVDQKYLEMNNYYMSYKYTQKC